MVKIADPYSQFSALLESLKSLNLAYLHVVASRLAGDIVAEKIDFLLDISGI